MSPHKIVINEYPFGCELVSSEGCVIIRSPKEAKAIIESLTRFLESIPEEYRDED